MKDKTSEFLMIQLFNGKNITFIKVENTWNQFSWNQNAELLKMMIPSDSLKEMTWDEFKGAGCILIIEARDSVRNLVYEDSFEEYDSGIDVIDSLNTRNSIDMHILNEEKIK